MSFHVQTYSIYYPDCIASFWFKQYWKLFRIRKCFLNFTIECSIELTLKCQRRMKKIKLGKKSDKTFPINITSFKMKPVMDKKNYVHTKKTTRAHTTKISSRIRVIWILFHQILLFTFSLLETYVYLIIMTWLLFFLNLITEYQPFK